MLALSLLLSAAAGVNAILGGNVEAIKIPGKAYICADDCAFQGVFFAQSGYFCPEDETVLRVDEKGNLDDEFSGTAFQCNGEEVPDGLSTRQPSNGEKPWDCEVKKITNPNFGCYASKSSGDVPNRTVEWSDIEKELKLTTENKPEPEEAEPQTEKKPTQEERNKCGKPAQEVFAKCRETGTFEACEEKGREVMKSCLRAL